MELKNVNHLTELAGVTGANDGHNVQGTGNGAAKGAGAQAKAAGAADRVSLTDAAARLQALESTLASVPVVDTQRVQAARHGIVNGTVGTDSQRTANKLLQLESQLPRAVH